MSRPVGCGWGIIPEDELEYLGKDDLMGLITFNSLDPEPWFKKFLKRWNPKKWHRHRVLADCRRRERARKATLPQT